jgi:hypothetical protein
MASARKRARKKAIVRLIGSGPTDSARSLLLLTFCPFFLFYFILLTCWFPDNFPDEQNYFSLKKFKYRRCTMGWRKNFFVKPPHLALSLSVDAAIDSRY